MTDPFYEHPILNSPYEYPRRHWELDKNDEMVFTFLTPWPGELIPCPVLPIQHVLVSRYTDLDYSWTGNEAPA